MLLAAEVDGAAFRLAQFTRFARDAVVEADVEPRDGRLLLDVTVHGAPSRIEGLMALLKQDGALVVGAVDDEAGRFTGTVEVQLDGAADGIATKLAALREHAHSVRVRVRRGRIAIVADVREGNIEVWRERLGELDAHWTLIREKPTAPDRRESTPRHA